MKVMAEGPRVQQLSHIRVRGPPLLPGNNLRPPPARSFIIIEERWKEKGRKTWACIRIDIFKFFFFCVYFLLFCTFTCRTPLLFK